MRTNKKRPVEKGGTAEKAFHIENTELVNKRLAVSMAIDPSLSLPQAHKPATR
jgi:hypothetical protein